MAEPFCRIQYNREQVMQRVENDLSNQACLLLGSDWTADRVQVVSMSPDGSLRRFCRLEHDSGRRVVAIGSPPSDEAGLAEARSGWHIGCHLFACGAPVPEQYRFDEAAGLLICEDLGDVRLHDLLAEQGLTDEVRTLYGRAVEELARMQVRGADGFDPAWCWDSPCYDRQVMLERESGYFARALCRDLLELQVSREVEQEFRLLAERASAADSGFFLHRDFQSRNIMVLGGRVRFIDFQAGRLGPPAYDLASLLIDPYAALPKTVQQELLEQYLDTLDSLVSCDRELFRHHYRLLAIQRNLQILGAFAFLSSRRNRIFFKQYLVPALVSLAELLGDGESIAMPALQAQVRDCLAAFS